MSGSVESIARERGFAQTFLQVEVANEGARALYSRLGYATAWSCAYWRR